MSWLASRMKEDSSVHDRMKKFGKSVMRDRKVDITCLVDAIRC